nr:hypothetical protein [Tanacetum cinerariifolium]
PSPVEDYLDIGSPEVKAPLSPDYVSGPEELRQAPLSPNYVPSTEEPEQAPLSPNYPVYPEYMPPEDDVFLAEEQPLPVAATSTADSPGCIPEFDPNGDPQEDEEEDPEEEPADYLIESTVVALPPVDHVPSEERLHFASPTPSQEVRESSAAGAARVDVAPRRSMSKELGYGITDTWDELVGASEDIAPTTLQGVNQRVTDLFTVVE